MKNVCIVFNGGSYGTFIEWCLNYFSDISFPSNLPFTATGSSHKFVGNPLLTFNNCITYVNSDKNFSFVRFHPEIQQEENILAKLTFVSQNFKKVVYMSPTFNSIAWYINNKVDKIPLVYQTLDFKTVINQTDQSDDLAGSTRWEVRESLSYFLYRQEVSLAEINTLPTITNQINNLHIITLDALKNNFENTILSLLEYCNLTPINVDKLNYVYTNWLACQYHIHKDDVVAKIIDSTLTNDYYDWSNESLTLVDEALIQHHLRQNNIKLKCYKLNVFPTNTTNLRTYFE